MSKKGLTKKGKARKVRIYEKLILKKEKTQLIAHFYNSILPMFKSFVVIFEQRSPQVHRIDSEISELTCDFFSCFAKHKSLKESTGSKFKKLNTKIQSTKTYLYIGSSAEKIARKLRKEKKDDIVREFQSSVKKSFMNTAIYMQQKFPLTNKLLISLSGLDPTAMGHSATYNCLKRLSEYFPTILTDSVQKESYLQEISNIQLNENLPPAETDGHLPVQLDIWWEKVFKCCKYPTLSCKGLLIYLYRATRGSILQPYE